MKHNIIFNYIRRLLRGQNNCAVVGMQLGPRRSYLLREDGTIVTIDSCICITEQNNKQWIHASNRGFICPIAKHVIWPLTEGYIADYEGLNMLAHNLLSYTGLNKSLYVYATTMLPNITDVEIKAINDSIKSLDKDISLYLICKPIAIAIGAGIKIDSSEPAYIIDMHCDCRTGKESHYGIWLSELANEGVERSEYFYSWEDNVISSILSKINECSPKLYVVGDCDDIYRFCRSLNDRGAQAVVPQNPDCIALQGIIRMLTEKCFDINDAMIDLK